jgi:predicted metal-binding membrane protein
MRLRDALLTMTGRPPLPLLAASLAGWMALLGLDRALLASPLCLSFTTPGAVASAVFASLFAANPPDLVVLAWLAMLLAMMPPLLTQPIARIRLRSLMRRRHHAVALFVTGYGAVWIMAGSVLMTASAALGLFAAAIGTPALPIAAAVAIIWQMTPWRQHALIRCHRLPCLSAFGFEADRDCLRFGLTHGLWCVVTCAPLMLVPLCAPEIHLPLMAALAAGLLLERLAPPRRPCWTSQILPGQRAAAMLVRSIRWSNP